MTHDELINIVAALDSICMQTVHGDWIGHGWGSIDDVFHTLFDDFDRRKDINSAELNRLYVLLELVLTDCGDAAGNVFTAHPLWPEIVSCANHARRFLVRN